MQVKFSPLSEPLSSQIKSDFPNYTDGLARGDPGGFLLSPAYANRAQDVLSLNVRPDDRWIVTFPKSGTTWTQELIWLLANNCDFERAKQTDLDLRFPFLECSLLVPNNSSGIFPIAATKEGTEDTAFYVPFDNIASLPSPRFIKTHLPFYLLPPNLLDTAKVVYVARNPKDVIVSYFYHHNLFKVQYYKGEFDTFADYFMKDQVLYSPYFAHVFEAWNMRHHPNLLFLFYEDLKMDLAAQVRKVADFLATPVTDEMVARLTEHLQFENFVRNDSVNKSAGKRFGVMTPGPQTFIRKGIVGDWKNHFTTEMNARVDSWIQGKMKDTDLRFITEL